MNSYTNSKCLNYTRAVIFSGVVALVGSTWLLPAFGKDKKPAPTPEVLGPRTAAGAWPDAPRSDSRLMSSAPLGHGEPFLQIQAPLPALPPNDIVEEIAGDDSPVRGTLLYAPLLHASPSQQYFIMRGVGGVRGTLNGQQTGIVSYRTETPMHLAEPQFSPDGKRILFRSGRSSSPIETFQLFLWDIDTGQLTGTVNRENILFHDIAWSPDSRRIAYIRGGTSIGDVDERYDSGELQLRIYDLDTDKSRRVVKNRGAREMTWTNQGTLLFTMNPQHLSPKHEEDDEQDKADPAQPEPDAPLKPSIYEVPAKGGKAKMIIDGGFHASPSPDGRWIAYLQRTPEDQARLQKLKDTNVPANLYFFGRTNGQSTLIGSFKADDLRWTPDSQSLVVIDYPENRKQPDAQAAISVVNAQTRQSRKLATLKARDNVGASRNITSRHFTPLKLSRDSRYLFVSVSEYTGVSGPYYQERMTLRAVNLSDGSVFQVARIEDPHGMVHGWDWYDETGVDSLSSSSIRSRRR